MGTCWGSTSATTNKNHSTNNNTQVTSSNGRDSSVTSSVAGDVTSSRFCEAGSQGETESGQILPTANLKIYTFAELKSATRNFKLDTMLGEGGFGRVFKGWVDEKTLAPSKSGSGMVVAVKKRRSKNMQGFQEWQSEVNISGKLSHPNLVKLLGYCSEDTEQLLVSEFMQKGSLEDHLFQRSIEPIPWDIRIKIALGAARGLAFLHTSENHIIYRNFKTSHILLDGNYNAKISDFSFAKPGPASADTHVTTRVMGTYGYVAPEYIATGHLYLKSDVYGFGVVLLEILTGLRAIDSRRPIGQKNLIDWAKPMIPYQKKLKIFMDARMDGQYSKKAAFQAAQLSLKCLAMQPRTRPSMKEVAEALQNIEAMKIGN